MRKPTGHARFCRRPQSPSAQLLSSHSICGARGRPLSGPVPCLLLRARVHGPGLLGLLSAWTLFMVPLLQLPIQPGRPGLLEMCLAQTEPAQLLNVSDSPNQSWVTFFSKITISDGFGCTFLSLAFCLRFRPTVSSSDTAPAQRDNLTPALLPVRVTAGDLVLFLPSPLTDTLAALHQLPMRKS